MIMDMLFSAGVELLLFFIWFWLLFLLFGFFGAFFNVNGVFLWFYIFLPLYDYIFWVLLL
jgi:hypothetical protein